MDNTAALQQHILDSGVLNTESHRKAYYPLVFAMTNTERTDMFDDTIGYTYVDDTGERLWFFCHGTTGPGKNLKGVHKGGVATVAIGYHANVWYLHMHNWKYEALCQRRAITITRHGVVMKTFSGVNCHMSNANRRREGLSDEQIQWLVERRYVGNWSHGCIVFLFADDLEHLVSIVRKGDKLHGASWYSEREERIVFAIPISFLNVEEGHMVCDV